MIFKLSLSFLSTYWFGVREAVPPRDPLTDHYQRHIVYEIKIKLNSSCGKFPVVLKNIAPLWVTRTEHPITAQIISVLLPQNKHTHDLTLGLSDVLPIRVGKALRAARATKNYVSSEVREVKCTRFQMHSVINSYTALQRTHKSITIVECWHTDTQ